MFTDSREPLVEAALHVLCVTLDNEPSNVAPSDVISGAATVKQSADVSFPCNNGSYDDVCALSWLLQVFLGFHVLWFF